MWLRSIFLIFGIFNGFGIINPFNLNVTADTMEEGMFSPLQIVAILFIGCLTYYNIKHKFKRNNRLGKLKSYAVSFIIVYSIMLFTSDGIINDATYLIKLFLGVILIPLVPPVAQRYPKLIYHSLFGLACIMIVISIAFMAGLMTPYMRIGYESRITLFGENSNTMSGRIALAMLIILDFLYTNPFKLGKYRYLLFITYLPLLVLLLANGSRGSFIILVLCFFTYILVKSSNNIVNKYIGILFTIVLSSGFIIIIAQETQYSAVFDRLGRTIKTGNTAGREELISDTMDIISDDPIIGFGRDGYKKEMNARFNEKRPVHNAFFYVWATGGIFSLMLYSLFWFYLLKYSWNIRKTYPMGITLYLWAFLIANKTGGVLGYLLLWYVCSIVATYISMDSISKSRINDNYRSYQLK